MDAQCKGYQGIRVPVLATVAAGVLCACQPGKNLIIDSVAFNTEKATVVAIPDGERDVLQNAQCLWLGAPQFVSLNWEAIATVHAEGDSTRHRISGCTLQDVGAPQGSPVGPPWASVGVTGSLQACSGTVAPNPFDECRVQTNSCLDLSPGCFSPPHSNHPYCGTDCTQRADFSTTFKLRSPPDPEAVLSPTLYPLQYTRALARPMIFDALHGDPASGLLAWSWTVARAQGAPIENFTRQLGISKVRAFIPSASSGARDYLYLTGVRVGGTIGQHRGLLNNCVPNPQDRTEISADTCPELFQYTPTYLKVGPDINQDITWELDLFDIDHGGNLSGLSQNANVMIEFTLTNTVDNSAGPRLDPLAWNFGSLNRFSSPASHTAFISIRNDDSAAKWSLASVSLSGPQAADFYATLSPPRQMGDQLGPGGSAKISVDLPEQAPPGGKQAVLNVHVVSDDNREVTLQAPLSGTLLAPAQLSIEPASISFGNQATPLPWLRRLLLENDGEQPLMRNSIALSGRDAAQFHLFAEDGHSAVAPAHALDPGAGEVIAIAYCPSVRGTHQATLNVMSDVGLNAVAIQAVAPAAPAPLCPP